MPTRLRKPRDTGWVYRGTPSEDELRQELESVKALDIEVLAEGLTGYGEYDTIIRASDENGFEHEYLATTPRVRKCN